MKSYQKLAAFLAVLLLSVGMMSIAIDILGDISDLEFQTGTRSVGGAEAGGDTGKTEKVKGQSVKVESRKGGGERVLFEITYPTGTEYLRWTVGESYSEGEWTPSESELWVDYSGGDLEPTPRDATMRELRFFTVKPFFNISGPIPGVLNTVRVGGLGPLKYNSHLEIFSSSEEFDRAYGINYADYSLSQGALERAEVTHFDEYLQIPEGMKGRLEHFASNIVEGRYSTLGRLLALEEYLEEYYIYDEEYERAPNGTDPVEWFLFEERRGVCSQFNSAFVLLARSIGIPVRSVGGFKIKSDSNYQIVKPKHSHFWAEVHFEGLGWVTFDATPPVTEERPQEVQTYPTVTNITYNDPSALKGNSFWVQGTVTLLNGSGVDGLTVEVFLTLKKNETDAPCGTGVVREGFFNINCSADPSLQVGDYNLIAHTLPGGLYEESWSDPPIRIMTETEADIIAPASTFVNRNVTIKSTLIDKSNGEPIANTTITLHVGNETKTLLTDSTGSVSLVHSFDAEGNETITVEMEDSDYYLGSESSFGIAVRPPPEVKPNIFMIITTFPYNVIIFTGVAVIIGSVLLVTRKREDETLVDAPILEVYDKAMPTNYKDPKEGVVKLFNWFYEKSRRIFEGIEDSMTPREFQAAVIIGIPEKGNSALEYLVTAFEIADYSASEVERETYNKCVGAVELLYGMIEREQ